MPIMRSQVCRGMEALGIEIDEIENARFTDDIQVLSTPGSRMTVLKVPTNEELMIARHTRRILKAIH